MIESTLRSLKDDFQDLHLILNLVSFTYTSASTDKKEQLLQLFQNCVNKEDKDKVKTIADQLREEGIEQRTEFIINNMLKKNLEVAEIASMTGVRVSEIKKIIKKREH